MAAPLKFAANLSLLYGHLPWPERFAAAAADGFEGVEILFPYDFPADWYAGQLHAHGLRLVLINTPCSEGAGRAGLAALPGRQDEFRAVLTRALSVAGATACRTVHTMAGLVPPEAAPETWRAVLLDNLRWAADRAARAGVVLTLEALNRSDVPGYAYHRPEQAVEIIEALGSPHVRLQFDLYHAVKEALALPAVLERALPYVRHVQIAGAPERREPDLARDGLLACFGALVEHGYDGWIGCEYRPRGLPRAGLGWRDTLAMQAWPGAPGRPGSDVS